MDKPHDSFFEVGIPRRGGAFHRVHDMAQPNIFYCYTLADEQSLPK